MSDLAVERSLDPLLAGRATRERRFVRLFNPSAHARDAVASESISGPVGPARLVTLDADGSRHATQVVAAAQPGRSELLIRAAVPPLGDATVELRDDVDFTEAGVTTRIDGRTVVMESDHYRIELDPAQGGTIRSLVAKSLGGREFVDPAHERRFNKLRGHFYDQGGFHSSTDQPARVQIIENGPLRATAAIAGTISGQPFTQRVSITQGTPVIDCSVRID